jgi:hypothetical protein
MPKPIKGTLYLIHFIIFTMMQENQHIEPLHKIVRIKMKQLGGGGMPQDAVLSEFLKNKLQKTAR